MDQALLATITTVAGFMSKAAIDIAKAKYHESNGRDRRKSTNSVVHIPEDFRRLMEQGFSNLQATLSAHIAEDTRRFQELDNGVKELRDLLLENWKR